ncbi:uncharacterized aarF domain-containing protein kinase 5-like [Watersipora subatra]|uniref:uncharacterized aarF domain-containing protein kinase 5-like n=1 Tax=Watersipora subatra TaxID=2589382 RepID=UPI00355C563C
MTALFKNGMMRSWLPRTVGAKSISTSTRKSRGGRLLISLGLLTAVGSGVYYSQDAASRRKIRVTFQGVTRYIRSIVTGATVALDYKISLRGMDEDSEGYQTLLGKVHKRSAERILDCCLKNGGLYIKLGQSIVMMSHVIPKQYLDILVVLQDKVLPRGPGEVEDVFLQEFGKLPSELFKSFEEEPIAAASLAQVHKAVTHEGDEVAVKVQYIDLRDRFLGDMTTLKFLADALCWLYPFLPLSWILEDMKGSLSRELDFLAEGANAEKCADDLAHLKFIHVPKVYWSLTSLRVLTTEFIDGVKISNKAELAKQGLPLKDIDYKLFRCFADQIFHSGHVHADPHPGNLYVRKSSDGSAELVLLDHGLYEYIDTSDRVALANFFKAIVLKDEPAMQYHAQRMNVKEWHVLACFLTQKYVASKSNPPPDFKKIKSKEEWLKLPEEDKKKIQEKFKAMRGRMSEVMKTMPKALILITRNLNTVRSIGRDHGNLVDRYTIMARSAVEGAEIGKVKETGFTARIKTLREKARFEYYLKWESVKTWLMAKAFTILHWMGRVPDLEEMLNKSSPKDIEFAA